MDTSQFYDAYVDYQAKSGINDRIYSLFKRIRELGLRRDEKILEIGCGIGALTFLLSKKVTKGLIEAFDPSARSIELATERIKQSNVHLCVGDILTYSTKWHHFDKIILFDVLEHIPSEHHNFVFKQISAWIKEDGLVVINIPNPDYILYDELHQPQNLQEIDQPIFIHQLLPKIMDAGMELIYFDMHSVWVKEDYHFFLLRKKRVFEEKFLHAERGLFTKGKLWIRRKIRKFKDPFL